MSTFEEAGVQSGEESIGGDQSGVKMNGTIGVSSSEQLLRQCLSMQACG